MPSQSSHAAGRYPPTRELRERSIDPIDVLAEAEQQWIFTEEELLRAPSIVDGMAPDEERSLRQKGNNFITQVGIMLKLPQTTLSTAAVFFNRFLMRRSLVSTATYKALHQYVSMSGIRTHYLSVDIVLQQIAAITLFLATKVEEACRKIKELVIACCRVAQKNPQLLVDEQTKDFWRWRDTILLNEDVVLEVLCFDLTFDSPYRTLHNLIKYYSVQHNKQLRDSAWSFINDSNMTQLCLLYTSRTIACAALYCGAKHADVAFPDERGRPWWEVQRVTLLDIRKACNYMADFYAHVPGGVKAGIESIYVGLRSPIDGSASEHRTRLKRSQTPTTPEPMERSTSEQSLKRGREEESQGEKENGRDVGTNGHPPGPGYNPRIPAAAQLNVTDRPAKRAKTEEKTEESQEVIPLPSNGSIKPDLKQEEDAGSEEGEVEE
jgi:protein BUR2